MKHKAKKSLGQHFLRSDRALREIIEAADLSQGDVVLEIGPGEGVLTAQLLQYAGHVIAIEKDEELFAHLSERFSAEITSGKLELISGDVLAFSPITYNLKPNTYKLVANIPYNITGAIFEQFLSSVAQPSLMVVLIQKEVAERIVVRDGKQSILSIAVAVYGTPRIVSRVPRGAFAPAPAVDSAILAIEGISRKSFKTTKEESNFFKLLRAGFAHKRKLLIRNLEMVVSRDMLLKSFELCGISPATRAETLSVSEWALLNQTVFAQSAVDSEE